MFKKMLLALVAAAVLAVSYSGVALAAQDHPEGIRVRGEVISVDPTAGKFRIETNQGSVQTFFVSDETHFRGKAENLVELEVGWKVGVGALDENGKLWAVLVLSGDPEDYVKARGKVTDVNISAGKFTIDKPDGDKMIFFVDENTRYSGQISALDDLQEGWQAGVVAQEESPGKLLAVGLVAGDAPELLKTKGTITLVDLDLGKFEIDTDDGRSLSFYVDEKTRYQGQSSSLEEMQVGWNAGLAAKETDDGLLAILVIAGTRPEGVRAQGIIIGVDTSAGKFQLEKSDGDVLTVYVDGKTRYKGQVDSIDDLENGMRAGFVGYIDSDAKIIARIVLAGDPRPEHPEDERFESVRPEGGHPDPQSGAPLEDFLLTPDL